MTTTIQMGSILVIDDNPSNLSFLTAYLEASGYEVLVARTGESGIEKAEYASPDLILLDLMMPGINGFEVCKRLKASAATLDIPVIFMTALNETEHKLEGLRLGAVDYITKPIQQEEVLLRVSTHVRLKRLTQQLEEEVLIRTQELVDMNQSLQAEIAERRQAEAQLAYQAMLLTEVSDAIVSIDNHFRIQSWNRAAEQLYGWTETEALGCNAQDLFRTIYPASSREDFNKQLAETMQFRGELIHHHKNGREIPVWANLSALRNEHGEIFGYVTINRDITFQKEAENQQLKVARLQERSELLNNLLGNLSHDLRTPLAIIETNLYLLERATDAEKRSEKILALRKQTKHLQKLIADLLTLSRLDHQVKLSVGAIQLNNLLKDIVKSLDTSIIERQQNVEISLAELPTISANESELYRALINLIENALNYTPQGGNIQIKTGQDKVCIWVDVIDNGIGIAEDELPYIFERYYRADKARNINTGGSGLGLSIVKRIVDMHEGQIYVSSVLNQGTRVRLSLPNPCP